MTTSTPSIFTITYVGTISNKYPIDGLLKVLSKIKNGDKDFRLRFVGAIPQNLIGRIIAEIPRDSVEFIPYVYHDEAIKFLINSSMLLLIIPEHKTNKSVITGKIFEYIASGKPVLCLGPEDGDAASILEQCKAGICSDYNDLFKIESFILSVFSNSFRQQINTEEYSHKNIAKKLISFIK